MKRWNELGLAAGLVAALAVAGVAQAQGASTGSDSTPSQQSGSGSSMGSSDTGSTSGSTDPKQDGTGTSSESAGSTMGGSSTGSGSSSMGSTSTGSDQGTTGSSTGSAAGSKPIKSDLRDGLEKLHAANQGEIQAAQMALTAAQSPQVKEFAQKMVDDHTQNDQELTQMAQSMGVDLSGKAFQKKQQQAQDGMKKVQGKTGASFDRAYMSWMVKEHAQVVKDTASLAKTATKENQAELAEFLTKTHATLQQHHTLAQQIDKVAKAETGTSARQGRTPPSGAGTTESSTGSSTGSSTDEANTSPSSSGTGAGSEPPGSPDKTDAGSQPSPTGEGHTGAPGSSGTGTSSGTETEGTGSSTSSGGGQ